MAYIDGKKILFSPIVNIKNVQPVLQEKSITITENGTTEITPDADYDGLSKVSVNVNVEGAGGDLIEVDELPEIGEEGKTYVIGSFGAISAYMDGTIIPDYIQYLAVQNGTSISATYLTVDTKPIEDILESGESGFFFYYVKDENDIFYYSDTTWFPLAGNAFEEGYSFKGEINNPSEMTENGYYALNVVQDKYYKYVVECLDIVWWNDGNPIGIKELYKLFANIDIEIITVETRPDTPIASDTIYYYIRSEKKVSLWDGEAWNGDDIVSEITDKSEVPEDDGAHALMREPWIAYTPAEGTLNISDEGTYDVANYKTVTVKDVDIVDVTEFPINPNTFGDKFYRKDGKIYKWNSEKVLPNEGSAIGTWYFNDKLILSENYVTGTSVEFYSRVAGSIGNIPIDTYSRISVGITSNPFVRYLEDSINSSNHLVYENDAWADEAWRTITIYEIDETANAEFVEWLKANAIRRGAWEKYSAGGGQDEGTISITLTSPLTTEFDVTGYAKVSATAKAQDKTVEITENGSIVVARDNGFAGMDNVYINTNVPDNPLPVEIATEAAMNNLLNTKNSGAIYKYTGDTTTNYKKNGLYILELSIIPFTIKGTSYEAEFGMTWEDWVNSRYNVAGYFVSGDNIRDALDKYFVSIYEGSEGGVAKTEIIEINHTYGHTNAAQ